MGKKWNSERKTEHYYKMAKKQNYRSRASYKLQQLNKRFKVIKAADKVVDLGAAPGGWSQIALEAVGEEGTVVGVDLEWIRPLDEENFHTVRGDFTKDETLKEVKDLINGTAQVVISDAAPKLTGIKDIDTIRSTDLADNALTVCDHVLMQGGNFVLKVFQGVEYDNIIKNIKERFKVVKTTKPPSSRKASVEMYVVAKGFRRMF
ncbi:Ribosomal RNA large subunit methyltransferase E [Methanobacterium lacus]|uniref:Ribosomal RNA large subunit methyltransferase E n=1 Tax=Methanobacterium lacus (strain AL-21) TaxID=877455 RepID=F0T9W0_METLA|nr:RlmE family RNA methyltransferase [Methanobacterium lacus]ADZ08783.1 Ribosomal RNA large subunit methyltransferase E [Methanobacterium lacus]